MSRTLLQQARDALEAALSDDQPYIERSKAAITALREALAAPEPDLDNDDVLWLWKDGDNLLAYRHLYPCYSPGGDPMTLGEPFGKALFRHSFDRAAPPAAPAPAAPVVPLKDGQIRQIVRDTFDVVPLPHDITFARAIEAAHGITGASK